MTKLKCWLLALLGLLCTGPSAPALTGPCLSIAWFDPSKLIETGVYYYPEAWPKSQWQRDLRNMKAMGFEFTHIGEFAWSAMEPIEGQYRLGWIDTVLSLAQKEGLKVILCTPSPAPPAWLTRSYPDVLMVDANGKTMQHQGRTHASWSSARYKLLLEKVNTQLAKRFGNHPAVWGWQIDNEPSHYGRYDYSLNAQNRFRDWVRLKYGSLTTLNAAWGTSFWSNTYSDWSQIRIPNNLESTSGSNPHQLLDYKRFYAQDCAEFIRNQQQTLRQFISPKQWVTTNYMSRHTQVDPSLNKDLDVITYTMYPVYGSGGLEKDSLSWRLGAPDAIDWANDRFRPFVQNSGVMELQPGQVNWGPYNPQPQPGAVRMWLWHVFAGGNKLVCSYRFRQPRWGSELYHYGMVGPDGVTPTRGGLEYSQFIKEVRLLRQMAAQNHAEPARQQSKSAAVLFSQDNQWNQEIQPQTKFWPSNFNHMLRYYNILKRHGIQVDVLDTSQNWATFPVVILPAYQLLSPRLAEALKQYALKGGHVVLSCRSGTMDANGQLWQGPWAQPILNLIGAKSIPFFDNLPPVDSLAGRIQFPDDFETSWQVWADVIEPEQSTEILAVYRNQFYEGKPAVIRKKWGSGTVTYIGAHSKDGQLETKVIRDLYLKVGYNAKELPAGLALNWRDGFWIACNYSPETITIPGTEGAKFIIGSSKLLPAQVAVWTK